MIALIERAGRTPRQRSTLYGPVSEERQAAGLAAGALDEVVNTAPRRRPRRGPVELVRARVEAS